MIHPLLKFDLIARCAIITVAISTTLLAWFTPLSLTAQLIAAGGSYATIVMALFTACVVIGLLDILINDFLPPQITLIFLRRRRYILYHVLAGLYFVRAFASVGETIGNEDLLPLSYILIGMVSGWYSWASAVRAEHD